MHEANRHEHDHSHEHAHEHAETHDACTTTTAGSSHDLPADRPARHGQARPARPVRRRRRGRDRRLRRDDRPDPHSGWLPARPGIQRRWRERRAWRSPKARSPRRPAGPIPPTAPTGSTCSARAASCAATSPAASARPQATAEGIPLRIRMKVYDLNGDDATVLSGAGGLRVALRPRRARYSMYSEAMQRTRTTCAACRRPTRRAGSSSPASSRRRTPDGGRTSTSRSTRAWTTRPARRNKLRTSQLALPEDVCVDGLRVGRLRRRASATSTQTSLDSDNVFSDGYSLQMAKVTGSNDEGYVATLNVPV